MEHPVRKQLREDLRLSGMADRSQSAYIEAVDLFFRRTWLKPEDVTEKDFAEYLKFLQDNAAAKGTFKVARYAISFLFRNTMQRDWPIFKKGSASRGRKSFPTPSRIKIA